MIFFDATCTKCKRRYGWRDHLPNKCPHCGHIHTVSLSDKDEIEKFKELLKERKR